MVVEGYALSKFESDLEESSQTETEGERIKDGEGRSLNPFEKIAGGDGGSEKHSNHLNAFDFSSLGLLFQLHYSINFSLYYIFTSTASNAVVSLEDCPHCPFHILYHRLVFYDSAA